MNADYPLCAYGRYHYLLCWMALARLGGCNIFRHTRYNTNELLSQCGKVGMPGPSVPTTTYVYVI